MPNGTSGGVGGRRERSRLLPDLKGKATNGIRKNNQEDRGDVRGGGVREDTNPGAEFAGGPNPTAQQLFDYMTFRARREGQDHTLSVEFYEEQLDRGIGSFFGVEVGPHCKGLARDVQQPDLFKEWLGSRT
jgi:hypothetical protein